MLTEQLQTQIEQEAEKQAALKQGRVPAYRYGYKDGHYDAAEKYADLWQAAEARADRYEKALKEIQAKATFPRTENESGVTIYNILKACNEALTPKTSTDADRKTA